MSGFLRRLFKRGAQKRPNADTRQEPVLEWETQDFIPRAGDDGPVVDPWDADAPEQARVGGAQEPSAREAGGAAYEGRNQNRPETGTRGLEPVAPSAVSGPQARGDDVGAVGPEPPPHADAGEDGPDFAKIETGTEQRDRPAAEVEGLEAEEAADPWLVAEADAPGGTGTGGQDAERPASATVTPDDGEGDLTGGPALRDAPKQPSLHPQAETVADASDESSGVDTDPSEPVAYEPAPGSLRANGGDAAAETLEPVGSEVIDADVWEELSAAEADPGESPVEDELGIEDAASSVETGDEEPVAEDGGFDSAQFDFGAVEPVGADEDVDIDADIGASEQADPWAEDLGAAFEPFDFDPDAFQSPWDGLDDANVADITPQDKAARIAAEIDVVTPAAQRQIARELTELFQRLTHPATFRALATAADNGLTPALLRDMIALREVWAQRPDFWLRRNFKTGDVYKNHHGAGAMTWALARRVCLARDAYPPEDMVDPEWVGEWLLLERGEPGYLDFAHFVDLKLANVVDDRVTLGLRMVYADLQDAHVADRWDWTLAHRITDDCYPLYDGVARDRAEALWAMQQAKYPDRHELHPIDLNPDFSYGKYGKA